MKKRFMAPVVSLVFLLAALSLVSCSSRHVAEKPDTKRPTVESASPAGGATAVAITTAVTCTFSEAMNALTINEASFLLESASSFTTTVVGTVTMNALNTAATFTPDSPLKHNTNYTATITTAATDAAGNSINAAYSWSFTTIPAPGALDKTFGAGGKVTTALGLYNDTAWAAEIQQDGKIVIAGFSTSGYSALTTMTTDTTTIATTIENYFTVARFQSNGSLDATFGFQQNGRADYLAGTAMSVGLQSDGKIVAAGENGATETITKVTTTIESTITSTTSSSDFLIARYNANGTLDTAFGLQSNGTVALDMGYERDVVNSLAIQDDGKIVVVGDGIDGMNEGLRVHVSLMARLNTDGTLDTSFAAGGKGTDTIGTTSRAKVVKIQTDGKIVVGGNFQDGSGPSSIYLARYETNGAPDTSFNSGMVTASPGTDPVLADIALLPNGKIIVAGTTKSANSEVFLMRFNADGTLDTTFGSAGTVISSYIIYGSKEASGLAVQADGKIVVSATFRPSAGTIVNNDTALLRFDSEGVLDTTFGNGNGMVTTDAGNGNNDLAYDVQIQQDGRIVVVGMAWNGSNYDIGIARYWP